MEVSYVLAGYNERKLIESSVNKCIEMLERDFSDYELILIDDASKDGTGDIMRRFAQNNPKVKYLENVVNLNFGTSVLRGVKVASKPYVVYNAVDLPFPLDDTKKIIRKAQKYDVLVLERVDYNAVKWRRITSKGNSFLLHLLFPGLMRGTPVTNYVQVYRTDIVDRITPLARSPIFVWPEMIFRAKLSGLRVGNMKNKPDIKEARSGAFGHPHDILWGVYDMLRFRIRCWENKL